MKNNIQSSILKSPRYTYTVNSLKLPTVGDNLSKSWLLQAWPGSPRADGIKIPEKLQIIIEHWL